MTIAEKLVKVAENVPKVYDAGKKSMVDEGKIIEKTVSGSVISLDDVSEVPHEVSVQLSSDTVTDFSNTNLISRGLNLISFPYPIVSGTNYNGVIVTVQEDGGININGTSTAEYSFAVCSFSPYKKLNGKYSLSLGVSLPRKVSAYLSMDDAIGNINIISEAENGSTDISDRYCKAIRIWFGKGATFDNITIYPMFTYNTLPLPYEPYKEPISYKSASGTFMIPSQSPYMVLETDTNGINITATYHKSWGMQTEYDRFWNAYQNNGGVMNGYYAFSGEAWNDGAYNPKYDIKATGFTNMFRSSTITNTKVTIDLSEGTGTYVFNNATKLITVPKIIVNKNIDFTGWFASCALLTEIRFEGTIGKSLDIHWSTKLSMASLASIVVALSDTVTGQTITFPTTAESNYDSKTYIGRWKEVVASKPNWTFAYA